MTRSAMRPARIVAPDKDTLPSALPFHPRLWRLIAYDYAGTGPKVPAVMVILAACIHGTPCAGSRMQKCCITRLTNASSKKVARTSPNGKALAAPPKPAGRSLAKIRKANLKRRKTVAGKPRLGPCVGHVRNYLAIGLNYSDHAAEGGNPIPKEPVVFNKAPSCICGPNDNTMIPKDSTKLDYECELVIVIGKRARYLA